MALLRDPPPSNPKVRRLAKSMVASAVLMFLAAVLLFPGSTPATAETTVDVDLDAIKTLPRRKSATSGRRIRLTPPPSLRRKLNRRKAARRRAEARRRKKAETARRKAVARLQAEEERRTAEAKKLAEKRRRAVAAKRRVEEARRKAGSAKRVDTEARRKANRRVILKPSEPPAKPATKKAPTRNGETAPAGRQTAKLPPRPTQILFSVDSAKLSAAAVGRLQPILKRMVTAASARLVIYAYATGTSASGNNARRLSLKRALAVRRHLAGKGIPDTRTEIRALGSRTKVKPLDRVDLILIQR